MNMTTSGNSAISAFNRWLAEIQHILHIVEAGLLSRKPESRPDRPTGARLAPGCLRRTLHALAIGPHHAGMIAHRIAPAGRGKTDFAALAGAGQPLAAVNGLGR